VKVSEGKEREKSGMEREGRRDEGRGRRVGKWRKKVGITVAPLSKFI